MSGASSWLQRMRKAELLELADSIGFTDYDGLKKTEIEVALDDYLQENASQFSGEARLQPFYKNRGGVSSPVKREIASLASDIDSKAKSVRRRTLKAAEELGATTDDSENEPTNTRSRTALTRTPRASALSNLSFASSVPLPPSPAQVTDAIDRSTQAIRSKLVQTYEDSGVVEVAHATRETLSRVLAVQLLIAAFESYFLRQEVLADRFAFTFPAIRFLTSQPHDVYVPDMFLLLTSSFWGPTTLWLLTSFIIPLTTAYFFNLTSKPPRSRSHTTHFNYTFDPLTFNIVKALLTYVIYGQDVTLGGWVDLEYVARINSALYGGYQGVLVGTGIGALVTLYEAIIKK